MQFVNLNNDFFGINSCTKKNAKPQVYTHNSIAQVLQ